MDASFVAYVCTALCLPCAICYREAVVVSLNLDPCRGLQMEPFFFAGKRGLVKTC